MKGNKIPPLCGSKEASKILDIKSTSIPSARKLKGFPEAIEELECGPIFIMSEIVEYANSRTKRKVGD